MHSLLIRLGAKPPMCHTKRKYCAQQHVQLSDKYTNKQVFDFDNKNLLLSPNTIKLSIVPVAPKICIQRDVFTQWDIHCYKQ